MGGHNPSSSYGDRQMNKKEATAQLAARANLSQVKAAEIMGHLFDVQDGIFAGALASHSDGKVLIAGFCTLQRKLRASRAGVHPTTQAPMQIEAKNVVSFRRLIRQSV